MESSEDHAFRLSDVASAMESASCEEDEALAVLSLLSRPSVRMLRMELRSEALNGAEVTFSEFIKRLTDWWKRKSVSDEDWKRWSSDLKVRWVRAGEREEGA